MNGFCWVFYYSSPRATVGHILLKYFNKYVTYLPVHDAVDEGTWLQVGSFKWAAPQHKHCLTSAHFTSWRFLRSVKSTVQFSLLVQNFWQVKRNHLSSLLRQQHQHPRCHHCPDATRAKDAPDTLGRDTDVVDAVRAGTKRYSRQYSARKFSTSVFQIE